MRFYEYESKALFARHGMPLGKSGLAKSADDARRIAAEIGGPVVLKSQVLSGGRMKAGGVKFADTPDEAARHYDAILPILVNGQKCRARAGRGEERRSRRSTSPRSPGTAARSAPS